MSKKLVLRVVLAGVAGLFACADLAAQPMHNIQEVTPCKARIRKGSAWSELPVVYQRSPHVMPMSDEKRCDLLFQHAHDSTRFRISFCHVPIVVPQDSVVSRTVRGHLLSLRRARPEVPQIYDASVQSPGCASTWGLLLREDEIPLLENLLRELSFENLPQ